MDNNNCPNCGKSLPSNAAFCGYCGSKVSRQIPKPDIQASTKYPPQFFELDQYLPIPARKSINKQIPQGELNRILRDFEKGKGEVYLRAKQSLQENLPLAAVRPLWAMQDKFSFPDEKKKDVLSLIGEIGGEEVVKVVTGETFTTDLLKHMRIIASINSPTAIPWLAENSSDYSIESIVAMKIIERFNKQEAIADLIKSARFTYIESEPSEESGYSGIKKSSSLLPGLISAGIKAAADVATNHNIKVHFAGLIPGPFVPVKQLKSDTTHFAWTFLKEKFRLKAVIGLADKFGTRQLEDCWQNLNPKKDDNILAFLSGCYLYKGLQHPILRNTVDTLTSMDMRNYFHHSRLIFLMDCLISGRNESSKSQYLGVLSNLLNHKEKIVSTFINSSILYNNFTPLISEVLSKGLVAEHIPAIVFSNEEHRNPIAKALLDGAKDPTLIKNIEEYKQVFSSWKVY